VYGLPILKEDHAQVSPPGFSDSAPPPDPAVRLDDLSQRTIHNLSYPLLPDTASVWPLVRVEEVLCELYVAQ